MAWRTRLTFSCDTSSSRWMGKALTTEPCPLPLPFPFCGGVMATIRAACTVAREQCVQLIGGFGQWNGVSLEFPAAAQVIARDAEEEPAEGAAGGIESFGVANQSHKNLLGHVFGHRAITAHVQGETVDGRVFAMVEQGEGILVSGNHPAKQQTVVYQLCAPGHVKRLDGPAQLSLHIRGRGSKSSRNC